jgi:hypothetical protein
VAGHHHAVLGQHQVGLHEVCTLVDGGLVRLQRVFGQRAGRAAVADHQRQFARQGVEVGAAAATSLQQGKREDSHKGSDFHGFGPGQLKNAGRARLHDMHAQCAAVP